jgi:hypothetical protein
MCKARYLKKTPISGNSKNPSKWGILEKTEIKTPNNISQHMQHQHSMGPEWRAWRQMSDEDVVGTSRRLGFGREARCNEEVVTLAVQQSSVGDCLVWRSLEECGGEHTGQNALTGLMGSLN